NSPQGQVGLAQILRHLGEERTRRGLAPAKCVVVHAMVVETVEAEKQARGQFNTWLAQTLRDHYLGDDGVDDTALSIPLPYRPRLALFPAIDDVAGDLCAGPYLQLGARIRWADTRTRLRHVAASGETISYKQLSDEVGLGLDMQRTGDRKRI